MSEKPQNHEATFNDFFGNAALTKHHRKPRARYRCEISISAEQSRAGIEKSVTFERLDACSRCQGSGAEPGTPEPTICPKCTGAGELRTEKKNGVGVTVNVVSCPDCSGTGRQMKSPCRDCKGYRHLLQPETRTLKIPAGTQNGAEIVISGAGDRLKSDGTRGDVTFVVKVEPEANPVTPGKSATMDFAAIFDSFFNEKPVAQQRVDVLLSAAELEAGVEKTVVYPRNDRCEHCAGSGAEPGSPDAPVCPECAGKGQLNRNVSTLTGQMVRVVACPTCRGTGKHIKKFCHVCSGKRVAPRQASVTFPVPAGTKPGTLMRMPGVGDLQPDGTRGDVFFVAMLAGRAPDAVFVDAMRPKKKKDESLLGFLKGMLGLD